MNRAREALITAIADHLPSRREDYEQLSLEELMAFMDSEITDEQCEAIQFRVHEILHSTGGPTFDID